MVQLHALFLLRLRYLYSPCQDEANDIFYTPNRQRIRVLRPKLPPYQFLFIFRSPKFRYTSIRYVNQSNWRGSHNGFVLFTGTLSFCSVSLFPMFSFSLPLSLSLVCVYISSVSV